MFSGMNTSTSNSGKSMMEQLSEVKATLNRFRDGLTDFYTDYVMLEHHWESLKKAASPLAKGEQAAARLYGIGVHVCKGPLEARLKADDLREQGKRVMLCVDG
jgi:regulator of replication initiation timing